MNKKEFKIIIEEGEGYNTEFKENIDKSLAKELVAFSNSSGGKILLGVTDAGEVKGVEITNRFKSLIIDLARNCDPQIIPKLISLGKILIVEVPEGKNKPYQCGEGFFVRIGATSQKMKRDEILKFIFTESVVHFDKEINRNFDIKKDFSKRKFKEFLKIANISLTEKAHKTILKNLGTGIYEDGKFFLNNTGVLMFAKEITKFFRHSFVTCVLYKGKDKTKVLDRKDAAEDLLFNYHNAMIFLEQHLSLEYVIKGSGPRREILEIPQEALKEALLNALIHRDYYDERVGIFVEIFDDRVEITNKGNLLFDRKYLGKISLPRNPLIFDLFHKLHFIEKIGLGISRIKNACKNSGVRVKFDTGEFFIVTFRRKTTQKTTQKISPLTNLESKILNLIYKNNNIIQDEIAQHLKISINTVKEYIKKLKDKKVLTRIGPDRGGHWEIRD